MRSAWLRWGIFFGDGILWYTIINENENDLQVKVKGQQVGIDVTSVSGTLDIPPTVSHGGNVYTVVSVEEQAFYGYSSLTSVIIPDNVTSIGNHAFFHCSSLTSITIPDSVTSIGKGAFLGCSSLASITIPDGVTSIEEYAFDDCSSLASITIPDNVTSIGYHAFYGCSSLASITIPDGVTSIGKGAFYGCSSLASITIPDGVTSIEFDTFQQCTNLTSVTIPGSVTFIDDQAFRECSSLKSITIPDSVTSIGYGAFHQCSSLESITIGDGVTSIGQTAFSRCSGLESIIIPDSVTSIGQWGFANCSSLANVKILNDNIDIGVKVFENCELLNSLQIALTGNIDVTPPQNIGNDCFKECPTDRSLILLTEDGTTELSDTTTPKLAKAVKAYDEADGPVDGYWYGWKLPEVLSATDYPVTIKVNKDGSPWSDSEKTFALSADNGSTFITDLTNNVPAGTYTIYDTTGATDSTGYAITDVTIDVTDAGVEATVNYYTVTFYDDDTPFGEPQIVLNNATVSAPSATPTKDGYTFYRWVTSKGGNEEFDFINNRITAKTDIYASWIKAEEKTFTITASAGTGGSVSPSGDVPVISGADQQFTITPQEGYRVSSVLVDGVEQLNSTQASDHSRAGIADAGNGAKYFDFENVTSNHTLTAAFAATSTGGGGSGDTGDDDDPDDNNGGGGSGGGGTGGGGSGGGGNTGDGGSGGGGDTGGSGGSDGGDTGGGSDNSGDNSAGSSSPAGSGNSAPTALSDTSVKNGTNVISVSNTVPASKDSEPKTGDASHMEIYATIAMIAGLSYLLLYFADGKNGMTEEEKKEIVAALVTWAKNGSRVKKYAALAVIFLILVYYHSIGKRTTVDWKEVYEK